MTDPKNLETRLREKAGLARAVSADRVRYTLDELLTIASDQYPLPPEQREWVDAPAVGRELLPEDMQTAGGTPAKLRHVRGPCTACAGDAHAHGRRSRPAAMPARHRSYPPARRADAPYRQ